MEYTTIGESCSVVSGGTPSRSKNEYWIDGTIPWIKIGNIKSKYVNEYDELITEKGLNNSSAKLLEKGTILYTIFATLGEVGILDIEACTNQAIAGITINDSRITTDYLYYYLKSKKDYVNNIGRGVAQNNINLTTLKKFEIPLIDINKQLNIVKALEKSEELIALKKKEIDDLDLLIKARFIEMFGDILGDRALPLVRLCELADIGSSKRIYANEYAESGIPFYRSKEIRELGTGLKPSIELFIKQERYDEIKEKYGVPKVGDILIAAIGATIGYSWIVDTASPFYYKDGNLIVLSIKDNVNPIFLNHAIGILIEDFKKKGVAGSAQLALTIEKLEKMMVVNPELELQNQFADFVQQVDKSREEVKKSLEKTQQLYDSLMQEYFG